MNTLNFSIGKDFGLLLVNLAREKLLTDYNVKEAIDVLIDALHGIEESAAVDIILGKQALVVDVENQELSIGDIYEHCNFQYDYVNHLNNQYEILKSKKADFMIELDRIEGSILDRIESDGNLSIVIKFPPSAIFNSKRSININAEIDDKYWNYIQTINDAQKLKEKILKINDFIKYLKTYNIICDRNFLELADELTLGIDRIVNFEFDRIKALRSLGDFPQLKEYFEANKELSNTLKIATPRKVYTWNACWIDREGNIYGADGTAANYLHLKIAEALVEHDVIPKGSITNSSAWLEKNGWVKMKDNWVTYAGYYGIYDEVLPLTDAQIQTISNIGDTECYGHMLYVGDKKTSMSAAKFKMMDKPLLQNVFKL
jgi:hypothetical protein